MTVADDLSPAENDTSEDRTRGLPLGLRPYWWAMVLALRELGGRAHRSDLLEPISAIMDLSPEMLAEQLPSRTGNYFEFNLDRAAQDLKDRGIIRTPTRGQQSDDLPRGYRKLTPLGWTITEAELLEMRPAEQDQEANSPSSEHLASMVERFRQETGYPTEDDLEQKRLRAEWAEKLTRDNIAILSRPDLLAYTNNAVDYGQYVDRREDRRQQWILDLDDAQYKRLLDSIRDLCWGKDELSTRIDRLVDWVGGFNRVTGTRGFTGIQVSRTLSICFSEQFIPLPAQGGREKALGALNLPATQGSYGQRVVDANDRLRDHLMPYFGKDTQGMVKFIYWLYQQTHDDDRPSAWMIRGGRHGQFEQQAIEENIACIGWSARQVPDLANIRSRDELAQLVEKALPEGSEGKIKAWVGQLWRLKTEIRRGDLVAMPMKTTSHIALGIVSQEYWYRENIESDAPPHVLSVDWIRTDVSRSALKDDLRASLGSQLTICAIRAKNAAWRLQQLIETGSDPGPRKVYGSDGPPSLAELADELLVDEEFLDDIVELLRDKGQVILYGPPGTGKTYLARKLAKVLAPDESCRALVQFHPSTSYEDFFEGYRPAGTGKDGSIRFELMPGPLARLAEQASEAPDEQHVMIIDEINRGNLPRVLGELLFLLEYRNESVQTLYRPEEPFSLPDNLWFIGTMNTADRSIALVDAALRRRFHFVPFFPDSGPMSGLLERWIADDEDRPAWVGHLVEAVNRELKEVLEGSHLLLGPSHFMKEYSSSLDEQRQLLRRIWEYNIEPFIEDQFFGDPNRIEHFRFDEVMSRHGPAAEFGVDAGDDPEGTDGSEGGPAADGEATAEPGATQPENER